MISPRVAIPVNIANSQEPSSPFLSTFLMNKFIKPLPAPLCHYGTTNGTTLTTPLHHLYFHNKSNKRGTMNFISFAPGRFSLGAPLFLSPQNLTLLNFNSSRKQVDEEWPSGCAASKSLFYFIYLFIYLFTLFPDAMLFPKIFNENYPLVCIWYQKYRVGRHGKKTKPPWASAEQCILPTTLQLPRPT